jgi:DNA-binding response OmpR family regulator
MADRLLVVEDDADAARLIDRALRGAGFSVHRVPTGEDGLAYLAANPVAGIVLDYRLPFTDGLQVLRRIRERALSTPIVMISSAGTIDVAVRAIKGDAFDFIEKHHNYLPSLVATVRSAIAAERRPAGEGPPVRPASAGRDGERRSLDEALARAAQLVASARAIANGLGLPPVPATAAEPTPPAADAGRCRLRRTGDRWEIAHRGRRTTVPHRIGMEHLRRLVERPGAPVSAAELAAADGCGLVEGDGGAALGRRAVGEVRRRAAELRALADAAEGMHDLGALAACRGELERLEAYLRQRGRGMLAASDRVRSRVTKAIARAIDAIRGVDTALARHLDLHVRTGRACVYVPDAEHPLEFDVADDTR